MEPDASSSHAAREETAQPRRRMSLEEDLFYRQVMTNTKRPEKPPSYETAARKGKLRAMDDNDLDMLPDYSCDVHLEGVFMRKLEIEETVKRAEDRNWRQVYVVLHGTALNIHDVKKERAWLWSKSEGGPAVSPDKPPWIKQGSLEKSYTLLHADAGIAADYRKRRYVIRVRAETDQFLLSCVEIGTFVKWLECLFAAIDVAAPIEERDFPRDYSIPRIQRLRWLRGQQNRLAQANANIAFQRLTDSQEAAAQEQGIHDNDDNDNENDNENDESNAIAQLNSQDEGPPNAAHPVRIDPVSRLSTTSYPNEAIDPDTGKWTPRHRWTETHDHLYAKLCYAVLLFKSPRKSNFVIAKGKQWFVDWRTGRMFRVVPPGYDDVELWGPWQVIAPENRLI